MEMLQGAIPSYQSVAPN